MYNLTFPLIVQSPGSPRRHQHNPALVTPRPSKVQDHILSLLSVSNTLRQAAQEAHSHWFEPRTLKNSASALPQSILMKRVIGEEDAVHLEFSNCSTLQLIQHCTASRNETLDSAGCWQSQGVKILVRTLWRTAVSPHHRHLLRGQETVSTFCIFHRYVPEENLGDFSGTVLGITGEKDPKKTRNFGGKSRRKNLTFFGCRSTGDRTPDLLL